MEVEKEVYFGGIDEAGRGPVLGPMVYSICYFKVSQQNQFKKFGFADSKTLTEAERESLFTKIKENNIGFEVDVITPEFLSFKMLQISKFNLNSISHESAAGLIEKLVKQKKINLSHVYVDTVGPPKKYQDWLKKKFPTIDFTVSKKADSLFPIVSAASICAKVTRDRALSNFNFRERNLQISRQFGSGYPGDPATKEWLRKHIDLVFGFPSIIRFSWKTCDNILNKTAIQIKWFLLIIICNWIKIGSFFFKFNFLKGTH
eukprot:TRINITY_DN2395_c0_g3_i1.p1 TRINITY_DN2395_c0_g3~~TRINITY_DN2395_c0_g3_i1.p1  ORF type:complete len:260 (-),score=82.89 TRINITY_DN2395_c0_g3_i1:8-787(-)